MRSYEESMQEVNEVLFHPERFEIPSREVGIVPVEGIEDRSTTEDAQLLAELIRDPRELLLSDQNIVVHSVRGRALRVMLPNSTHYTLSGGFSLPLDKTYDISQPITTPTSENWADDNPGIVAINRIENCQSVPRPRDYVPTGAYTRGDAQKKAKNTLWMERYTQRYLQDNRFLPFDVPRMQFIYTFPGFNDPNGDQLYGVAYREPTHAVRFEAILEEIYLRIASANSSDKAAIRTMYDNQILNVAFLGSIGARYMHISGKYHNQYTLGNIGYHRRVPYIADWDTAFDIDGNMSNQKAQAASDLHKLLGQAMTSTDKVHQLLGVSDGETELLRHRIFESMIYGYIRGKRNETIGSIPPFVEYRLFCSYLEHQEHSVSAGINALSDIIKWHSNS